MNLISCIHSLVYGENVLTHFDAVKDKTNESLYNNGFDFCSSKSNDSKAGGPERYVF